MSGATFTSLGLPKPLSLAAAKLVGKRATVCQASTIPLLLDGDDVLLRAPTGSGKTIAFLLPALQVAMASADEDAWPACCVLVPTRELVDQVADVASSLLMLAQDAGMKERVSVYGCGANDAMADTVIDEATGKAQANAKSSSSSSSSIARLTAARPQLLIITPGRLVELLAMRHVSLAALRFFAIDEADAILAYGHGKDVKRISRSLPQMTQGVLCSATLDDDVSNLKSLVLSSPKIVKVDPVVQEGAGEEAGEGVAGKEGQFLTEYTLSVARGDKYLITYALVRLQAIVGKVLFFTNSIDTCYRLKLVFERFGIRAAVLNSELPGNSRRHIIDSFNHGAFDFLIATDEANAQVSRVSRAEEKRQDRKRRRLAGGAKEAGGEEEEEEEEEQSHSDSDSDSDSDGEGSEGTTAVSTKKRSAPGASEEKDDAADAGTMDHEFSAARGIDFLGVGVVVNFDAPRTLEDYTHRVGRTARGGTAGVAISIFEPRDEKTLEVLSTLRSLVPYTYDEKLVDGLRYRVEDVVNGVAKRDIAEARVREVRAELLNSQKLRTHFEDNPAELQALRAHNAPLLNAAIKPQLRYLPSYLLPQARASLSETVLGKATTRKGSTVKRRERFARGGKGKKKGSSKDPLMNKRRAATQGSSDEAGFRKIHNVNATRHKGRSW
jgi:ATP-dependent RNA helicase DDX56/DBP9